MDRIARLFYADSERDADLYYLTRFLAGDPFLYLEAGGRKELFLSDLEVDRGKAEARVDAVERLRPVMDAVKDEARHVAGKTRRMALYVRELARERDVAVFEVPESFPLALADALRGWGFGVRALDAPAVPARAVKTADEIAAIRGAIGHTQAALAAAIDRLRAADIDGEALVENGAPLTSEQVRFTIDRTLLERGCHGYRAIVAGGEQGVDPHERGHGPLPAHAPIILDVFPRDLGTRYHGDMTRTVVRGTATDEMHRAYAAVRKAKAVAEGAVKAGADGWDVHKAVQASFEDDGFETGERDGRMVGFFHGTGHGLGLDVHEYPGVGAVHHTLEAGHVVTIEPGLYYPGLGGFRVEDDVVVTADGCENLCDFPEELEM